MSFTSVPATTGGGFAGMPAISESNKVRSGVAHANLTAGRAVALQTTSGQNPVFSVRPPAALADKIVGICLVDTAKPADQLDQYKAVDVLTSGAVWVLPAATVAPFDPAYVVMEGADAGKITNDPTNGSDANVLIGRFLGNGSTSVLTVVELSLE